MFVTHDEFNNTSDIQSWLILTVLVNKLLSWGDEAILGKEIPQVKNVILKKERFGFMTLLQGEKNCSVLPRHLRLGGPPGLIHCKIAAAWPKNQRFIPTETHGDI